MFSGIVEYQAKLLEIKKTASGKQILLELNDKTLENLKEGASVAVNGVCLTTTKIDGCAVYFDLIEESLAKTNLGNCKTGDSLNIERALKLGDEIGGHLLSGHIFKTVPFLKYNEEKKYHFFAGGKEIQPYLHYKGFVALNGVSLTLNEVTTHTFAISIIPHTLKHTNLSKLSAGDRVNLELDSNSVVNGSN